MRTAQRKDYRFFVRFDARQSQRLEDLAQQLGKSKAEILRYLVDIARLRDFPDHWQPPAQEGHR